MAPGPWSCVCVCVPHTGVVKKSEVTALQSVDGTEYPFLGATRDLAMSALATASQYEAVKNAILGEVLKGVVKLE